MCAFNAVFSRMVAVSMLVGALAAPGTASAQVGWGNLPGPQSVAPAYGWGNRSFSTGGGNCANGRCDVGPVGWGNTGWTTNRGPSVGGNCPGGVCPVNAGSGYRVGSPVYSSPAFNNCPNGRCPLPGSISTGYPSNCPNGRCPLPGRGSGFGNDPAGGFSGRYTPPTEDDLLPPSYRSRSRYDADDGWMPTRSTRPYDNGFDSADSGRYNRRYDRSGVSRGSSGPTRSPFYD